MRRDAHEPNTYRATLTKAERLDYEWACELRMVLDTAFECLKLETREYDRIALHFFTRERSR